jgi:hypothetical protein
MVSHSWEKHRNEYLTHAWMNGWWDGWNELVQTDMNIFSPEAEIFGLLYSFLFSLSAIHKNITYGCHRFRGGE